jgi:DNA-binding IclR family transcriptional regulator
MLALLDAFSEERHVWTVEAMAAKFDYTHSSTYRYVRELCKSGLLVRLHSGEYVIGARAVELDSLIKETDPLTKACTPVLKRFTQLLGCHALLSNVYGDHLINVAHIQSNEQFDLAFIRGRRLPWFRGATSRAIVAFLPRKRVRKLFDDHYEKERTKENWKRVLTELKLVAEQGYAISDGELQKGVGGIGAPVIVEGQVMGSVTLVFSSQHGELIDRHATGKYLVAGCDECVRNLERAS